jgi:hypothetical protein
MRAKTINEFKRGGDPLVKMDIGNKAETLRAINGWIESLKTYIEFHEATLNQHTAIYQAYQDGGLDLKHKIKLRLNIYKVKKQLKKFNNTIERMLKLKAKYES